ncbi:methyltransferase domain-containing protein [Candidatus Woesearchaeota archaeon]|nr:methyltransferase domain-containing protein [Candidatus Woesearchaeota archaeon]
MELETTLEQEIYDRGEQGFKVYAKNMNASMQEKSKILAFVLPGNIVEFGCGNGAVLELLSAHFPESTVVGVDLSDTLLDMAEQRKYAGKVILKKADIIKAKFPENTLNTAVFCSVLHEVYSYSGYDRSAVRAGLKNAYDSLKPGGRLIIRDGVKPKNDLVGLSFKNEEVLQKFYRFAKDFGPYQIPYKKEGDIVKLRRADCMEFLTKYIYDVNWDIEVKEHFGFWSMNEYANELEKLGFRVVYKQSYLIDWLRMTHYEKNFVLFKESGGKLVPQPFPDSTMILVAEKP